MTIISTANKSEEELQQLLFKPIKGKLDECPLPLLTPAEAKAQLSKYVFAGEELEQAQHTKKQFTNLISGIVYYVQDHQLHLDKIIRTASDAN